MATECFVQQLCVAWSLVPEHIWLGCWSWDLLPALMQALCWRGCVQISCITPDAQLALLKCSRATCISVTEMLLDPSQLKSLNNLLHPEDLVVQLGWP